MKVLILAAGYGTRLYPHTKNTPKPLLELGGRPIINHLLNKMEDLDGICGVSVVTNARFFSQFSAWKKGLNTSWPVDIINDLTTSPANKMGAIKDMRLVFAENGYDDDYLVIGGDNIFKQGLAKFVDFARAKTGKVSVGLFDIKDKGQACHYGVVNLDGQSRVVEFLEKPAKPKSSLVAMCLYYFSRKALPRIEEYLGNPSNPPDAVGSYFSWLCARDDVYGFIFRGSWFDIGYSRIYKQAAEALKRAVV